MLKLNLSGVTGRLLLPQCRSFYLMKNEIKLDVMNYSVMATGNDTLFSHDKTFVFCGWLEVVTVTE